MFVTQDAPAAWIPSLFELLGGLLVLALQLFFDNTAMGQRMCAARLQQQQLAQLQQQQQELELEAEPKDSESKKDHPPLDKAIALKQKNLKLSLPSPSSWRLGPGTPTGSTCGSPLAAYSSSGFSSMFSTAAADAAGDNAARGFTTLEGGPSRLQQQLHKRGNTQTISTWDLEVSIDPQAVHVDSPTRRGLSAPGSFHRSALSHTPGAARGPTKLQWAASSNSRSEVQGPAVNEHSP